MFSFIRHSHFVSFGKLKKITYIHTYIHIHTVYIDIYKNKTHSSIKIQTMYNIILNVVIRLVPKYLS